MRNKFDLNKPVYHKSYGKMTIERYLESNLDEPDTENQYDCEYGYENIWVGDRPKFKRNASLFKESDLMSEEDYNAWLLSNKREETLKNILKDT
jgi:hypothetical protein